MNMNEVHSIDQERVLPLHELKIKIFSDGADLDSIMKACQSGIIKGFTTNPTLMARAGVSNYITFAREMLRIVPQLPVSFEVFSDDLESMSQQAHRLHELGDNVYVKIPVTNTKKQSTVPLVRELSKAGLKLNITAVFSLRQVLEIADVLNPGIPAIVSVFAGRIADSGRDPVPLMEKALDILRPLENTELLWASPREVYNIIQADAINCHIITVTPDLIAKTSKFGINLEDFSLETVKMFHNDALNSGFKI